MSKYTLSASKKKNLTYVLILAIALGASWYSKEQEVTPSTQGFTLQGKVVRVADGDTLTVRLATGAQQRIRLASIDAPETHKSAEQPGQAFAAQSGRVLSSLVGNKSVSLSCYEYDLHERAVCDVLLDDGSTANQRLVEQGLAWANQEKKGRFLHDSSMLEREQEARAAKRGLWSTPNPVAPWEWRYHCWQKAKC